MGVCVLIQITPQLRILVAIDAIDGRKGIDSLAQLCREKLNADPFSGYLLGRYGRQPAGKYQVAVSPLNISSDPWPNWYV